MSTEIDHDICMTNPGSPGDLCAVNTELVKAGWKHAVEQRQAGEADWEEMFPVLVSFLGGVQHHLGVQLGKIPAEESPAVPATARGDLDAPVLARVDLIDVAQHAITIYGRETAEAILPPGAFREHDYRFELTTPTGGTCTFGRNETAADIAAWLEREAAAVPATEATE